MYKKNRSNDVINFFVESMNKDRSVQFEFIALGVFIAIIFIMRSKLMTIELLMIYSNFA